MTLVDDVLRADSGAAGDVLARAFVDDPVAAWFFPNDRDRDGRLRSFFGIQLRHAYLPRGRVRQTTGGGAVALSLASWAAPLGFVHRVAHARAAMLLRGQAANARALGRRLAELHPAEPHVYLGTIGTAPEHQRRGLGSALVDDVVRSADRFGVGVHLECSREATVPFYERHGFHVSGSVTAMPGGPTLLLMWRPPQQARLSRERAPFGRSAPR